MIIGINGKLRQGKGILATMLGLAVADEGGQVLSNYWADSDNWKTIDFYDLCLLMQKGRQEPQKLIIIDELPGWLDSRVSMTKANRFGTYFLFQSAKLGYNLIYTAQLNMRTELAFRELCDLRVMAEKDEEKKCFKYSILDQAETDADVPTGRSFSIPFELASSFWNRYDTYEAVAPVGMSELFQEMEKFDPVRKLKTVQAQAEVLRLKQGLGPAAKLNEVKYALLCEHLPTTFASDVHVALQRSLTYTPVSIRPAQTPTKAGPQHLEEAKLSGKEGWLKLRKLQAQGTD